MIHLASQAGGKAEWSDRLQAFLPPQEADGWVGAGGFNGTFSLDAALAEGLAAGLRQGRQTPRPTWSS